MPRTVREAHCCVRKTKGRGASASEFRVVASNPVKREHAPRSAQELGTLLTVKVGARPEKCVARPDQMSDGAAGQYRLHGFAKGPAHALFVHLTPASRKNVAAARKVL